MMTLHSLIAVALERSVAELGAQLSQVPDISVQGLSQDSRRIQAGGVFIALKGDQYDGMDYVTAAVEAGAVAVLCEPRAQLPELIVPIIVVPNLADRLAKLAAQFYQYPSAEMRLVGVTGTNGKSSCAHFLAQCWPLCEQSQAGMIGTLGQGFINELDDANHTTPDAISLQSYLAALRDRSAGMVALEVSSHALEQGRVNGCKFAAAIFTNLSHDHLDYHGDMAHYAAAKAKLFLSHPCDVAVINVDDEYGASLAARLQAQELPNQIEVLRYSMTGQTAEVQGQVLAMNRHGLTLALQTPWGHGTYSPRIAGRFQASNITAVATVLGALGCQWSKIGDALSQLRSVPGRMQNVDCDQQGQPHVLVDYAHTPDALAQAIHTARELTSGALWCVFGCGGDRDVSKRQVMGAIAARGAEHVVITSDNPRNEKPEQIIAQIAAGITTTQAKVIRITERAEAIAWAIQHAASDDVVLVAGKGHETYQEIMGQRHPFDDVAYARSVLERAA